MLLILAVGYLSVKYLSAILPTNSYEDEGIYPYQGLPVQMQNMGVRPTAQPAKNIPSFRF